MDQDQASKLGAQVRRARKSREWTGEQLAAAAGVAGGTVVRIETGRAVRPGNLRAVLDALGIPPLSDAPRDVDEGVKLALDLVENWLTAIEDKTKRDSAIQELTRFVVLREH